MQAAFQLGNDEGCSTDDSHKLTRHITVNIGRKKVKPFTTTFTMISQSGKVCMSIFKPTKAVDELREIIPNHAKVRANVGQEQLLRLEGDNAAHDSVLIHSASPSLYNNVVPHHDNSSKPRYEVADDDFRYITTRSGLENYALALLPYIKEKTKDGGTVKFAIDTEFDHGGLRIISIAVQGYTPACVIHPYDWGTTFEPTMQSILELDCVLTVGCNVAGDIHLLRETFGIRIKRVRDNRRFCLQDDPSQKTGLQDLAATYLGVFVDKQFQTANYNVRPNLAKPLQP